MGREIRRVPPNWEHPRWTRDETSEPRRIGQYKSLYDKDYDTAAAKWLAELADFKPTGHSKYYWEYAGGPPNEKSYRPKFAAEPTWYQVYETVSEGSPVTPPFATQDELIEYLVTTGEMAGTQYQRRYSRPAAEKLVRDTGWAPSMAVERGPNGVTIKEGAEALI